MLVDLGRNDLGRVCEYGTVEVETFMAVETYSHVMHIVSSVGGRAARRTSAPMDALRSILPAGTLSGAPKVRAMEIIDELEPVKRGGYGGAIGYLSYTGDLDTCIHIRTVVLQGRRAHVQAGGGTVADAQARLRVRGVARTRRARVPRAIELARDQADVAVSGPRRRQLRLVHLQPRPVPGRAGGGARGRAQRRRDGRRAARARARPRRRLARPVHAERGGHLGRGRCAASPRRASRRSASASATSRSRRRSAARSIRHEPVHGKTTRSSTTAGRSSPGCRAPLTVGRYHSLVVDDRRCPTASSVTARGGGVVMGDPPPRAARRRRPVPPRVGADAGRQAPAGELPAAATRADAGDRCRTRSYQAIDPLASRAGPPRRARRPRCSPRSWPATRPRWRSPAC